MRPPSRREFLRTMAGAAALAPIAALSGTKAESFFQTRGVVLIPSDLTLADWPERAKRAGLSTIGLHHSSSPQVVVKFIQSGQGQEFLGRCRKLDLQVEYELHAMRELLPRSLFAEDKSLFRMNDQGERVADSNLCVHSPRALEITAEKAVALGKVLRPTTGRYFYWGDDGRPWCRCAKCKELSEADQALLLANHLCKALTAADPKAQLAYLAYSNTLSPPKAVKPASGVFLEYAPIRRRYDLPYEAQKEPNQEDRLELLDANLKVFGAPNAQVLEYWLDVSRFSHWKLPAVKLPWNGEVFAADLNTYGKRGIRHITSFAVFIDAAYVARHGEPPLEDYGARLAEWQPVKRAG